MDLINKRLSLVSKNIASSDTVTTVDVDDKMGNKVSLHHRAFYVDELDSLDLKVNHI